MKSTTSGEGSGTEKIESTTPTSREPVIDPIQKGFERARDTFMRSLLDLERQCEEMIRGTRVITDRPGANKISQYHQDRLGMISALVHNLMNCQLPTFEKWLDQMYGTVQLRVLAEEWQNGPVQIPEDFDRDKG